MTYDALSPTPEEPLLIRALQILQRRRLVAFGVFATILVFGLALAVYLPNLYRATAVVLVERQLPETVVRPAVSGELESRLHVIKQEILSRARVSELIRRFNLYPEVRERDMDEALEQVRRDIQIELTGPEQIAGRTKTVAFNLTFTGTSREKVAEVTNAIAAFYVDQNTQMRSEEAARTTQFLKSQIDSAKAELDRDEKQVKTYTDQHLGELPQQVNVNLATLDRLNTQLRINSERQLRLLEQRDKVLDAPVPTGPPAVAGASPEDVRLQALKRELALLEGFPDKHPDVRRIKDAIAALEAEGGPGTAPSVRADSTPAVPQSSARSRGAAVLDAELESLKTDEAALRDNIIAVERRLEAVPSRQSEFTLLSRDHQATRDQYESLLKRYEEARLGESMEAENQGERFRILEAAVPPLGPSAPNRVRLLILSFLLAVVGAGVLVLVVEQFDTSFHSVDDVRQFTRVPVLAAIPRIEPSAARHWQHAALVTASLLVGFLIVGALSARLASDNEPLVRLLVRGG